ncbi:MAG: zinc ABC transporter substrate-binding protein [Synergistaceae bacterium]|nr:zinc ABC transporter substrate-binding protein [Synergistaceae bacterium]
MRKIFVLLLVLILNESACADIRVTVSIFPVYDWTREIAKDSGVDVALLMKKGVDLHNYQPSVSDIVRISESDIFIYIGGESDEWVEDALKNVTNKNQIAINLLEILGNAAKIETQLEGMQEDHEHEHEHESELDEHIWLSLRNAGILCRHIAAKLSEIDPSHKKIYSQNLARYIKSLDELDKKYSDMINHSARKILLFADRFPFRYLADDYGLKCYAAFSGCSAETEASFETIKFLAEKTDEFNLPCVIDIDGTRHNIARTVIASTKAKNQKILVLNSMQSGDPRVSYLQIMAENLEILKEALN